MMTLRKEEAESIRRNERERIATLAKAWGLHAFAAELLGGTEFVRNHIRMAGILREVASTMPGVTRAYLHPTKLEFKLRGPQNDELGIALLEAAADLSVRLQRELAPDCSWLVEGCFEDYRCPAVPDEWHRLLP